MWRDEQDTGERLSPRLLLKLLAREAEKLALEVRVDARLNPD